MPRGRKPVIADPDVREAFLAALVAGNYITVACDYAGISKTAVFLAIQKGEMPGAKPIYRDFAEQVRKARSRAEVSAVLAIRQDASWQSKAWFLERSNPGRWGRKQTMVVEGTDSAPLVIAVRDEHAEQVAKSMRDSLARLPLRAPDETAVTSNGHSPSTNGHVDH